MCSRRASSKASSGSDCLEAMATGMPDLGACPGSVPGAAINGREHTRSPGSKAGTKEVLCNQSAGALALTYDSRPYGRIAIRP